MKISTRTKSVNESVDDRPKNICLSKRARTSVAGFQAECQTNGVKRQPVAMAKNVNFLKNSGEESDQFEKIRRLAAVEEGCDKRIKRKRSIGTILSRPVDSDNGVPKRAIQNRAADERGSRQHDAHISRSNNCDDSYTTCHSPLRKKKALRTTQIGSMVAARSSLGTPRVPETLEKWENAMDKETLVSQERDSNRTPHFGQWVGQRPPKVPRTRRSNLVSPVSNQDDSSPSNGTHDSHVSRSATNGSLKIIVKLDNLQSEIKESVGGERQTKGKMGSNEDIGPSVAFAKKNKALINEESVNGVLRQGRSGRGLLITRCSMSPMGKELDNGSTPKLLQSIETGSKKNGSKPGRRLKRLSDYKGLSDDVPLQNSRSPDYTGESDDDQEELLSGANHGRTATRSSTPLWKKMEPKFSPISSEEKSLLSQQLNLDTLSSEERKTHMPHQQTESFFKKHDTDHKASNGYTPFYQRVLSALIIEDDSDIDGLQEEDSRNIQIQNSFSVSTSDTYHLNDSEPRKKGRVESNRDTTFSFCGQSPRLTKKSLTSYEDVHSEVEMLAGTSKSFNGCQYEQMSVDDKLLLELQCIGLCLDKLPGLEDNEDETVPHEVDNLQTPIHQQGTRRSSRFGIPKVTKQGARCHKLKNSGNNCFNEVPLKDILSTPIEYKPDEHKSSVDSQSNPELLSDESFVVNRPKSNRGKSKKLLLNSVGTTAVSGGTRGKRTARAATKPPRAPKPRQKTDTPKGKFVDKPTEHPTQPSVVVNNRRDVRGRREGNDDTTPLPALEDLEGIDELVGGPDDFASLLSFNEEDLDVDFTQGLEVPDDDLTELLLF